MRDEGLVLALDFGGTKLTAALTVSGRRSWLDLARVFSPTGADAQYDIETMIGLGRKLLAGRRATAVGVSFGGPVDYATGTVCLSHHVPGWKNTPLQALIEAEFGAPVCMDNDANIAALGEFRFGAGQGYDSLLYITVSTGVGGGWVLNGRPWRGHEGMAGEIGHTVVDPAGPVCLCGKRGCVERLASGPYMAGDWAREQGGRGAGEQATGKDVAEMAARGDEAARRILLRGARALGVGIGNAANLINPQLFVLGGGVTKSGALWWEATRRAAEETAMPEVHFDIVPAALGDD
ncbi:MAG: ROK family protein, partial [Chloroflexi bacterium]|nr:ROK family protein [Chloroflexota bacterium]